MAQDQAFVKSATLRLDLANATAARILNADGRLVLTHDVKAAELTVPAATIPNGVFAANEDGKLSIISVPVSVLEAMGREELELRKRVPVGGMGAEAFGGRSWADEQNEELDLEQMRDTTVDAERF